MRLIQEKLTEEQRLLHQMVERFACERYPHYRPRSAFSGHTGFNESAWLELANLGLLGIPFDERYGGQGGGAIEIMITLQAFGRGLVAEPYIPTVVLAGGILRYAGSEEQRQAFLPDLISGKRRYAFAFAEPQSRYNLANVSVSANSQGVGYCVNGTKSVVYGAPVADGFFVTARTGGSQLDHWGISILYIDRDTPGVTVRDYLTTDGMSAADLEFDDVFVPKHNLFGRLNEGLALTEKVIDEATAAICAEASGAMAALNEKTIEYSRTRHAFGKALAEFQVLQHRLIDMLQAAEFAEAMASKAAHCLNGPDFERRRVVSAAKVQIGKDSRFVAQSAIQLHGAIGMTDELEIGRYFKRLTMIDIHFGNVDYHLRRFLEAWQMGAKVPGRNQVHA